MPVRGHDAASPQSPSSNLSHLFDKVSRVYKKKKKSDSSRLTNGGGNPSSLGRAASQEDTCSDGIFTRSNVSSSSRSSERSTNYYCPASRGSSSETGPSLTSPASPQEPGKKDLIVQSVLSLISSLSSAYAEVQAAYRCPKSDGSRLLQADRDIVASLKKLLELKQAYDCIIKEERKSARDSYLSDDVPTLEELLQGEEEEAMEKAQKDLIMKSYEKIIENFYLEVQIKNTEIEKLKDMLAKTTLKKENLERKVKNMLDLAREESNSCCTPTPSLDSQLRQLSPPSPPPPSLDSRGLTQPSLMAKNMLGLASEEAASCSTPTPNLNSQLGQLSPPSLLPPSFNSQLNQPSPKVNNSNCEDIIERFRLELKSKNAEIEKLKDMLAKTTLKNENLEKKVKCMLNLFAGKEAISCMPSLDSQLSQLSPMVNINCEEGRISECSHFKLLQSEDVEREKQIDMLAETAPKKEKLEKKVSEMLDFTSKEAISSMPSLDSQLGQLSQLSLMAKKNNDNEGMSKNSCLELQAMNVQREKSTDMLADTLLRKAELEKEVNDMLDFSSKEAMSYMPSLDSQLSQLSQLSLLSLDSQLSQLSLMVDNHNDEGMTENSHLEPQAKIEKREKPKDMLADTASRKAKLEKEVNDMLAFSSKEDLSCMPNLDSQLSQLSQLSLMVNNNIINNNNREGMSENCHQELQAKSVERENPKNMLAETVLRKARLEKEVNNMLDLSSKEVCMSCMPSLDSQLSQLSQLSLLSLESQLGQLSPKVNNRSNGASSTPPSQLFEGAAQVAFEEVRSFSKLLISLMKLSDWDLDSACTSIVPGVDFSLESHKRYAWESHVCHQMMEGFEDPNFNLSQDLVNKPSLGLGFDSYSSQYRAMKCIDPWELVNKEPSCPFSRFCKRKYLHLVHEKMEASFFGRLEHRLALRAGKHPDTNFYRRFLKLAKSLWTLHLLGSSFEPRAVAFEAIRGNAFSTRFMTSVAQPSHNTNPPPDAKVGFTIMPGFELHETIIKCQVYVVLEGS